MIRRPDETLEQCIIVGVHHSEAVCLETIKLLLNDQVTTSVAKLGFSFYPEGFFIEGVAYGVVDEEPIDAYDLDLKVLH